MTTIDYHSAAYATLRDQARPHFAAVSQRFSTATRLEVGFWDMELRGASG